MQDIVQMPRHMNELADIVVIETELLKREEVFDVLDVPRDQIVHPDYLIALLDKAVTEMGTKEAGSTGYEYAFHDLSVMYVIC